MTRRDFSERDIHMALDGELPGEEHMAYDAWLEANPEMKAKSARYIADRAAMRTAFAGVMDEPVPARAAAGGAWRGACKSIGLGRSRWWLLGCRGRDARGRWPRRLCRRCRQHRPSRRRRRSTRRAGDRRPCHLRCRESPRR
ncbi:anti-sigma factor family protein [Mesorhizobium atlanticum]